MFLEFGPYFRLLAQEVAQPGLEVPFAHRFRKEIVLNSSTGKITEHFQER